jgi:hypothetical protein
MDLGAYVSEEHRDGEGAVNQKVFVFAGETGGRNCSLAGHFPPVLTKHSPTGPAPAIISNVIVLTLQYTRLELALVGTRDNLFSSLLGTVLCEHVGARLAPLS